ncbi:MAG: protein arginine kinase [Candidatus Omnitrophota bacterium]|jgi:protein arginine kinase
MKLNDLINHISEWLKGTGPHSDIVISSRIRLARNLSKVPFPHWANKKQNKEVLEAVEVAAGGFSVVKSVVMFKMQDLDSLDKQFLVERHLMSLDHAQKSDSKALLVDPDEVVSIMVNEEDHIRAQVMQSGFNLFEAWGIINKIDETLSKELAFAFQPEWGYLTACPTNAGTGMRASVMLHLPALVMTRQINQVLAAISKLSFTARGLYGEGTQAMGNFFQISNQVSLGPSEEEIIENLNGLIRQIIEQEHQTREVLYSRNRTMLEDKINRSFGILKSAHIISSQETVDVLSVVRLGVDMGMIKDIDRGTVNELFIVTQPAHLQKVENKRLSRHERDVKRAEIIRAHITKK